MTASIAQPFYFLLSYWGDEFREYLCRLALPSLLSPGNLPSLKNPAAARLLIATTAEDFAKLKREPVFGAIKKYIQIEFVANEVGDRSVHKYVRMSRGHALLAERCFRDKAVAININPDSIYPDGGIAEGQRLILESADVILCAAIRFEMEGVEAELATRRLRTGNNVLQVPVREAVAVGLRNLHSESRASSWTARNFGALSGEHREKYFLTCCYWEVPKEEGMLIITHNWAPFFVNYGVLGAHDTNALDGRNLDGPYVFENFPEYTKAIHVVTDSDSLFLLGLTPREEMRPESRVLPWPKRGRLGAWARGYVLSRTVFDPRIDAYRRKIYRTPVRWHSRDFNSAWTPVECEATRIIGEYVAADGRTWPQAFSGEGVCRWLWCRLVWAWVSVASIKLTASDVYYSYYYVRRRVRFRTRLGQLLRRMQRVADSGDASGKMSGR